MSLAIPSSYLIADVKCYHCGHISGQVHGARGAPLKVTSSLRAGATLGPR